MNKIIIFLILVISCKVKQSKTNVIKELEISNSKPYLDSFILHYTDFISVREFSRNWKNDSWGCLNFRDHIHYEKSQTSNFFKKLNRIEILELLGKPYEVRVSSNDTTLQNNPKWAYYEYKYYTVLSDYCCNEVKKGNYNFDFSGIGITLYFNYNDKYLGFDTESID